MLDFVPSRVVILVGLASLVGLANRAGLASLVGLAMSKIRTASFKMSLIQGVALSNSPAPKNLLKYVAKKACSLHNCNLGDAKAA